MAILVVYCMINFGPWRSMCIPRFDGYLLISGMRVDMAETETQ